MNQQNPESPPDVKEMFGFVSGVFYLAMMTLGCFWALVMRKPGTLGTRAYWFDYGCANLLLLALRQFFPYTPLFELFTVTMIAMVVLFFFHLVCTLTNRKHVHTKNVGTSRFGTAFELLVGGGVGAAFATLVPGAAPYGIYIVCSAIALFINSVMIDERDRQRAVQMQDALWEQDYAMKMYEKMKKETE